MVTVVIPFAGAAGKTRLHASPEVRAALAEAMLADVLTACVEVGRTLVATRDDGVGGMALELDAEIVVDPGEGQGAAVAAALAGLEPGAILVVNADVPCIVPHDLRSLAAATPAGGIALVEAADGTTNALSLSAPEVFAPLYGSGSAARFRARAASLELDAVPVAIPNLVDDVDTMDDLARVQLRVGPRTQAALGALHGSLV